MCKINQKVLYDYSKHLTGKILTIKECGKVTYAILAILPHYKINP